MNPITRYLKNLFAAKRVLGNAVELNGLTKADAILEELVNAKQVPGIAITVCKEGSMFFQKGYGYANLALKVSIDPKQTIFRIASVSKPIAATALAHMVADNKINLDASFYEYVPNYPKKKWDFTIRQLASHTAGIRGYQGTEYGLNKSYSIEESIAIFKDDELYYEPGTNYCYSSYDWVLISLAIQKVNGNAFEEYVYEKVLGPMGMTNTFVPFISDKVSAVETEQNRFSPPLELQSKITSFYSKNKLGFRKAIPVNNFFKLAGGGYLSTSEDIAKFGQAYIDGSVLDKAVLDQFLTSETVNGKSNYYGLGWQVSQDKNGRSYYGHIGNGVGGYSNFLVYPKEQIVVAILINCTDPKVQPKLDEVVASLMN